jgi:hypothetical protein
VPLKRHLRPGGRFTLDMFVPRLGQLVEAPGERFPFAEYEAGNRTYTRRLLGQYGWLKVIMR